MNVLLDNELKEAVNRGDRLRKDGDWQGALAAYLTAAERSDFPVPASLCLSIARAYIHLKSVPEAVSWALGVVDNGDDFSSWNTAATLIENATQWNAAQPRRRARVAIVGSFTTLQLRTILPLALNSRFGMRPTVNTDNSSWIPEARFTAASPISSCWPFMKVN
jgi:hypothetical protein